MRKLLAPLVILALAGALVLVACGSSGSDSTSSGDSASTTTTTAVADGAKVSVIVGDTKGTNGPMTMEVKPGTVPAGKVTITASNTGTIEHEVVVLKTDTPYDQLAVTDGRVSEDDSVGEISEFAAGTSESVTLDLAPGNYVLVCNIADHYSMGMRAPLVVT